MTQSLALGAYSDGHTLEQKRAIIERMSYGEAADRLRGADASVVDA